MSKVSTVSDRLDVLVFVSAFTTGDDGAIHVFRLDLHSGQLVQVHRSTDVENPFFLTLSPDKGFLYSIHAPGEFEGDNNSEIAAYRIVGGNGELELLNRLSALGSAACYIDVDSAGNTLLVANYGTGSVASFALDENGSLLEASSFIQHMGSSVNKERQNEAHAHCIVFSPDNRFAFAADLGIDKIQSYRFEADLSQLKPNDPPGVDTRRGAGPRHLVFHPNNKHMYVINELDSSLTVFGYDPKFGTLSERQTISTLADGFDGDNCTADLKISPDGQFLYGTNRGDDSIAVYRIGEDGGVVLTAIEPSYGASPQNLAITPCGSLLLCANMTSNCIVVFRINSNTGRLNAVGQPVAIPSPSCIKIF